MFLLNRSNTQMKHSHKMPAMRGLPYTTNFLMIKANKKQKQFKETKPQKNVSKMYITESLSFIDRVGLVYLAVTCYFFHSQFFLPLME